MSYSRSPEPTERASKRRMDYPEDKDEPPESSSGSTTLALKLITLPLRPLRPLLPHLFPLLIFLLCIPLLMFFSGAAGWVVWRNVPVGWKVDAFLQYGEATNPFATVELPPILVDQPYDISLHLVLPTTESNYALGNFMATLRLTTAYNESITTIRRPVSAVLVPPRSSLLKQLVFGSPSTTKLDIPLVVQFVSGTTAVHARLELGRPDGWKGIGNGQGRELSVTEAVLKGTVRPKGIYAILARYPRTTTFVSTFTFFFVSLLVVCAFLFIVFRSNSTSQHSAGDEGSDSDSGRSSPGTHLNRRRYSTQLVKRESMSGSGDEKTLPASDVPESALRKRRSSPSIESLDTAWKRNQVRIEDMPVRRGLTPPPYPKSPYPRPESAASNSSLRRQSLAADPTSPSDADAESS